MTYALRSASVVSERPSVRSSRVAPLDAAGRFQRSRRRRSSATRVVPLKPPLPAVSEKIQNLGRVRRVTAALSATLAVTTLALYGSTVYTQHHWNRAASDLERLRENERQLTVATEALRQHVSELTAEENTGLDTSIRDRAVYIEPASPRPPVAVPPPLAEPSVPFPSAY
ncbi:hypothetical protein [Baaleninema simplex]|uniref:hypothetical protein n=1 Tax=Baaleninema simplex TaxID=2862350 RepID=UPI001181BC20|nr:hypothetical protein [Baaleninema simplex]